MRGALNTAGSRAEQRGITIHTDFAPDVPEQLRGDPDRLRQVLLKALENVMATSTGGKILVSVRRDKEEDQVSAASNHFLALLFMIENSRARPGRVQADAAVESPKNGLAPERKYGGSALGLELCGRLVRLMEGRLWLEASGLGNRLCFTGRFAIPERLALAAKYPAGAAQQRTSMEGALVLVVEDNRVNQVVAVRMLEKRGIRTRVANHGREALELLTGEPVDLVLMDIQMPEMDDRRSRPVDSRAGEKQRRPRSHHRLDRPRHEG